MLQFFKYVLATIVGLFLFAVLSFVVMLGIGSMVSGGDSVTTVKEKSVLKLNFDSRFTELAVPGDTFSEIFGNPIQNIGLNEFKSAVANAALDPNIKGISITMNNPLLGFGEMEEVRTALKDFRKTGKFIYTYSDYLSEKAVLIAALADSSFIHPMGSAEFNGLSSEVTFVKGTLDKLGIEPLVFRVGEFKSAVEPYIRTDMSAESREQTGKYTGSVARTIYSAFAEDKKMTKEEVDRILNKASMLSADESTQNRLVSAKAYADEYESALRRKLGIKENAKIAYVGLGAYGKAKKYVKAGSIENKITVIVSEGEIVQGKSSDGIIGSDDFVKEIRRARNDKKVKAVVLRINSPGGSAMASDIMWREIQLTRKEKPVIASMSDLAASGGYYMAMGCDTIVAHPATITGSIGIFGLMMNTQKLMNDKLGITFDGVKTHEFADSPSTTRRMSDAEKQTIQNMVNDGYETFTSKAARGRKMSIEKLKSIAGGRVWTGEQAKELGLVDVLGGLDEAIAIAAGKVNLKAGDFQVKYYPYPKSDLDRLMERLTKKEEDARVAAYLGEYAPVYRQLLSLKSMDKIQARMMFIPEFK
ncbi:signal peptide peptidase SppA [Leadbetterella sp. DM7]|uniref:signal peptide peptidase SppA n=1 Tax=Leadbetterella sp. DM7 TaxID=3235085 RepID=UPI00349EF84A